MAVILTCPHCQTRVLPVAGAVCPSCGRDTTTAATASDRLRVARRRQLTARPTMVTVLAGAMYGQALGYAFFVLYVLFFPSTYDPIEGDVAHMSVEVGDLMLVYTAEVLLWTLNATAFMLRWRFCRALYLISTPLWLAAPTVLVMATGHSFNEANIHMLLGMNLLGVPLTLLMVLIYFYFIWVLTRRATGRWLRGEPASGKEATLPYEGPATVTPDAPFAPGRIAGKLSVMQKVLSRHGRISRSTYWSIQLAIIGLQVLSAYGIVALKVVSPEDEVKSWLILAACIVWLTALLVISMLAQIKRWHDLGQSGWWSLLYFMPLINVGVFVFFLGLWPGDPGANRYGDDPAET